MKAKPFLKWAGGKTKLIPDIVKRLPTKWNGGYFEPFLGGGSVFFFIREASDLLGKQFFISDANIELVNTYQMLVHDHEEVLRKLRVHAKNHLKLYYKSIRARQPFGLVMRGNQISRAARFIYLNKTCFNGLYRVNRKNEFNVPMGSYKNPNICDEETILGAAAALRDVNITYETFHSNIDRAGRGDFIYCDPPYLPNSDTADFTSYTHDKFTLGDHEQLQKELVRADKRGAKWMLSEGDSPFIRKLFKGYNIVPVRSQQSVGASGDSRTMSRELLIMNYKEFLPWLVAG